MTPNSNSGFIAETERRHESAVRAQLIDALKANNPPDVVFFATRDALAISAAYLRAELARAAMVNLDPARVLRSEPYLLPFRIAGVFSVIAVIKWPSRTYFTTDHIRRFAASRNRKVAKRARLALACLGLCEWTKATREERVAFLYGRLIERARA